MDTKNLHHQEDLLHLGIKAYFLVIVSLATIVDIGLEIENIMEEMIKQMEVSTLTTMLNVTNTTIMDTWWM